MPDHPTRPSVVSRGIGLAAVVLSVAGCVASPGTSPVISATQSVAPSSASPTSSNTAVAHATGATDVVLRMEVGGGFVPIDFLATQAPTFTLYGNGMVIFQQTVETSSQPDPSGVAHGIPWRTAQLDEAQIQELLAFALGPGGLGSARDAYIDGGIADAPNTIFTIDAGGVDKTVVVNALAEDGGRSPDATARAAFWKVAERLRGVGSGGTVTTQSYQPVRYRGVLLDRGTQPESMGQAWPWTTIQPAEFTASPLPNGGTSLPRRTLSTAEVDALGIPDHDGGLQGILLAGPDGKRYTLVVRPLLPDEAA